MDHSLTMHMDQAPRGTSQLPKSQRSTISKGVRSLNGEHTSSNRFAPRCAVTYSLMFPCSIHPDTIANLFSAITTPIKGNRFGCRRALHVMTSLQNFYRGYIQSANIREGIEAR